MQSESERQERRIALILRAIFGRGRRQPGSGNTATAPNDVAVSNHLHVECKTTAAKQMILQQQWIVNASLQAAMFGVPAVVAVSFEHQPKDYFLIHDEMFYNFLRTEVDMQQLLNENRELRHELKLLKRQEVDTYEGHLPNV